MRFPTSRGWPKRTDLIVLGRRGQQQRSHGDAGRNRGGNKTPESGIGSSNPTIARWHGVPFDRPLGRVSEYIRLVQMAMAGEKVNFDGKFFSARGFKMAFKPSGRKIPIYLAAFGPKMSSLAGILTDGVVINMANPEEIGRIAEDVKSGAEALSANMDETLTRLEFSVE